jgi:hypothetical protein
MLTDTSAETEFGALNIQLNWFKVDLDGHRWSKVQQIIDHIIQHLDVTQLQVFRDTMKPRHYHISVVLQKPKPVYFLLAVRHLCLDDPKRVALDVTRLYQKDFDEYDWLGTRKGKFDTVTMKLQETARYVPKAYKVGKAAARLEYRPP